MLNRRNLSGENQQERRQRPQLVNPIALLNLHPLLDDLRVPHAPPPLEIHHHHPRVEVARAPPSERAGESLVGPERRREILGEVRVAVLRSSDSFRPKISIK